MERLEKLEKEVPECCRCGWEPGEVKHGTKHLCKGCYEELNELTRKWEAAMRKLDFEILVRITKP